VIKARPLTRIATYHSPLASSPNHHTWFYTIWMPTLRLLLLWPCIILTSSGDRKKPGEKIGAPPSHQPTPQPAQCVICCNTSIR